MFTLQAFKTDTLASDITDSAASMTLTTGAFGTPTGEQMLVVDYDVASKREIIKCAIDGTAVTSIDRAQDGTSAVAHSSGAKIIMAFVPSHYTGLTDGTSWADAIVAARHLDANLKAGWNLLIASGTRVSNTSMTVTGDFTSVIAVGDKLKLTDTTTKYYYVTACSYSAPNTTITFTGGTDYVLAGTPSNIYYSKAASPVGFPAGFTIATNQTFSMNGRIGKIQGWNDITASGTPTYLSAANTFGVTFTAIKCVQATYLGGRTTAFTNISTAASGFAPAAASAELPDTTGFTAALWFQAAVTNGYHYGIQWEATGTF